MKHGILIIGENIALNRSFLSYIFDSYEKHFGENGVINYINNNDKNLPFYIENCTFSYDMLTIFASNESYHIASKILATLSSDTLELKGQMLIPTLVSDFSEGSFLIKINNANINLINANPTTKLPPFLNKFKPNFSYFSIFDIDSESAEILLLPLAKTYNVSINLSQMVPNWTVIRAMANKFGEIDGFLKSAKNLFTNKILLTKDPISHIAQTLMQNDLTITFAESCTAGLLASKFASYSGVSKAFKGSFVTYANEIKSSWLGVSKSILDTFGAVSEECVKQMLSGALNATDANFALAISGIAGPDGGSKEKPVGTVFIGAASKEGEFSIQRLFLQGDRNYIREQSAVLAYLCLLRLKNELFFS